MTRARTRPTRPAAAVAALTLGLLAAAPPAAAAPPPGACIGADGGTPVVRAIPWAQTWLAPDRVWPFSTGRGVTVAVIDSGVDADHPQLRRAGLVLPGRDFLDPVDDRANFDCVSHGTAVASLIAAQPVAGLGFRGLAPGVRILPVRVSERDADDGGATVSGAVFAQAIRYAADQHAQVVNISMSIYSDLPPVRAAVRYAQARGALIVAAAGNAHRQDDATPAPDSVPLPDPVSYPAAYPGVLGVGAITIDGTRLASSQVGGYVDLSAPGGGVLAAGRQFGHRFYDGTSFATAFVSAAAALVRSADPRLTAAEVSTRLEATADAAPGAADAYGAGVVDPYRAVLDSHAAPPAAQLPSVPVNTADPAALSRERQQLQLARSARRLAVLGGVAAGGFGAAIVALRLLVRRRALDL